jgi:hypothetical protein
MTTKMIQTEEWSKEVKSTPEWESEQNGWDIRHENWASKIGKILN